MGRHIKTDGTTAEVKPGDGNEFSLEEIKKYIGGGYVEAKKFSSNQWIFLDEEGKMKNLPINRAATSLLANHLRQDDFIVGDVLVCSPEEAGEGSDSADGVVVKRLETPEGYELRGMGDADDVMAWQLTLMPEHASKMVRGELVKVTIDIRTGESGLTEGIIRCAEAKKAK